MSTLFILITIFMVGILSMIFGFMQKITALKYFGVITIAIVGIILLLLLNIKD